MLLSESRFELDGNLISFSSPDNIARKINQTSSIPREIQFQRLFSFEWRAVTSLSQLTVV